MRAASRRRHRPATTGPRHGLRAVLVLAMLAPALAHADALAELKSLLAREATTPIHAQVLASTREVEGGGKDAQERRGSLEAVLADDARGFRIEFAPDFLKRAGAEESAKAADPKASTPLLDGVDALRPKVLRDLVLTAPRLALLLQRSELKATTEAEWDGHPATLLSLALAREKLAGRSADYVKNYSGTLDIWLGAGGVPMAAKVHEVVSGRAFLFFTFEVVQDEDLRFAMVGDRLVTTQSESDMRSSGTAGEQGLVMDIHLKPTD